MTDIKLDITQLRTLAKDVVQEAGKDYVYKRSPDDEGLCRYVHKSGAVGCLIGQVLHKAGVPLEELAAYDEDADGEAKGASELPYWRDDAAEQWATFAQTSQDERNMWGDVLDIADRQLGIIE